MTNATAPTELGTEKISSLLKRYAIPAIIAMTASSLYNMVDSIFIGNMPGVGAYAISGLAVTFPLMNLGTALGTLVGVGSSTLVSMLLGQRNYEGARKVLSNSMTLNIIVGFIFAVAVLISLDPILLFFGASENTLPFAREYMTYILLGNVITHLYFGLNNLIRAGGNPKTAMGLTIFTVLFNAVLDPVFIYVFDMGIKGAAIATILCQLISLIYTLVFFSNKSRIVHFDRKVFGIDRHIAKSSLSIGVGPFLMNFASCIVSVFINTQLKTYGGDLAIGAYGIANRLTFIFLMIGMGFNQGMQPIAGYNWGAKQYSRVSRVFKQTAVCLTIVTVLCWLVSEFLPGPAVGIFTQDAELKTRSMYGLRMMNCMIWSVGFSMVSANFYQCLGMVKKSIFLSLSRQLLILVPLIYVLPFFFGENGVWYAFPISDIAALLIAAVCISRTLKEFSRLEDGEDISTIGNSD